MTLNGTLEDFSPAGILKVLSADGRTGAVRFGGPHGCTVYLHHGQLYFARGADTDECLATALVRPGRLSTDDWGQAIDDSEDRPMVGELLVRAGAIEPDLLASVVLSVIYDPLIELFRDGTGEFDFEPDTVHWLGPVCAFPVDAIVDEVRKRAREVDEWAATIPSLDVGVEARRTLPGSAGQVTLRREDWELTVALSGHATIRDLAAKLGRGAYSTARVVHRLQQVSLVEVTERYAPGQVVPLRRAESSGPYGSERGDTERDAHLTVGPPHPTSGSDTTDPLTAHIGDAIAEALADADHVPVALHPTLTIAPGVDEQTIPADSPRPKDPNAASLADLYAQFIDGPESTGGPKKHRRGESNPVDVAFKAPEQQGEEKVSTLERLLGALKNP